MNIIEQEIFDEERALYGCRDTLVKGCLFDGPADGESAFKECRNITVEDTLLKLRYPFWHDKAIVEIELSDENAQIEFPPQLKVICEVTDDPNYKNAHLAEI